MSGSKIFRYKFADTVVEELIRFSKIHQEDDRHQFKEAWSEWIVYNSSIVESEVSRLHSLGYQGDVVEKMFKSARYYFRKKSTEKKEPVVRRNYITVSKDINQSIDTHINEHAGEENYTPAKGYDDYCYRNEQILTEWIDSLRSEQLDPKDIQYKIKKTYKNRYYVVNNKKLASNQQQDGMVVC